MTTEHWLPISGFPDYEASDRGRVRSHKRYRGHNGPRLLRPWANAEGYLFVHLRAADGSDPVVRVHTLVMLAFVGERPHGAEVRHLDGDPANNALVNLRYGTSSDNSLDQVRHGTHAIARRTHCKWGHEYTPENTRLWTSAKGRPFRQCVTCHRSKMRRLRAERSAA